MTQLYLIAHKARGEQAFDIAARIECPICNGVGSAGLHPEDTYEGPSCNECIGHGYWWIIPTSGHRAYPYWNITIDFDLNIIGHMPDDLPDHYQATAAKGQGQIDASDLLRALGLEQKIDPSIRRF